MLLMKIQDCCGVMPRQLTVTDISEDLASFMFRILVIFFNSFGHENGESKSPLKCRCLYRLTLHHILDNRNLREIYN